MELSLAAFSLYSRVIFTRHLLDWYWVRRGYLVFWLNLNLRYSEPGIEAMAFTNVPVHLFIIMLGLTQVLRFFLFSSPSCSGFPTAPLGFVYSVLLPSLLKTMTLLSFRRWIWSFFIQEMVLMDFCCHRLSFPSLMQTFTEFTSIFSISSRLASWRRKI